MASNVPPPTSSTSEIPKFDFFPTTQTNLVDPMANMNISGGKRPPQPPAAQRTCS
ncbi:hypothetical protein BKA69DRAFT_1084727 [Paraphysoderma sedebokerense]|nr:hypothetical protein BKA69DRAFT_1084727 [Paraphysoderma sedebokerense]